LIFDALTFARAEKTEQAQKLVEATNQRFPGDFEVRALLLPCVKTAMKHILRTCEALYISN
jgi:hypothetical protein